MEPLKPSKPSKPSEPLKTLKTMKKGQVGELKEEAAKTDNRSIGAVVVAAGMSSRMGDFKPMMKLGSISVARRVISTLRQGGVDRIVVITGNRADELEAHLSKSNVIFIRNENYANTHMFDSACIGFRYIVEKCTRILFTPVDIPLFTADTVSKLISDGSPLSLPICEGVTGHPVAMSRELVMRILEDYGEGGLSGALDRTGVKPEYITVSDKGVLMDADTKEDYARLLDYHNRQLIRPTVHSELSRETVFFNERLAMLLSLIDETGSVRKACGIMQMSYRTSWNLLNSLDDQLGFPVLNRSQGGTGDRRSTLTEQGREFLRRYSIYDRELKNKSESLFQEIFGDFFAGEDFPE